MGEWKAAAFLLLAMGFASASEFSFAGKLSREGSLAFSASLGFENASPGRNACVFIHARLSDLAAYDRSGMPIKFTSSYDGEKTALCAKVPYDFVKFEGASGMATSKQGSAWNFSISLSANSPAEPFSASISLPEGATVAHANGRVSEGAGGLLLSWDAKGIPAGRKLSLSASYTLSDSANGLAAYFAILLAVALALLWKSGHISIGKPGLAPPAQKPPVNWQHARKAQKTGEKESRRPAPAGNLAESLKSSPAFSVLNDSEKEILLEIAAQGGKTTQAKIYMNTHMPKATLSRWLARLQSRDLVARSKKGNRKLVSLGEILQKKPVPR